MTGSENPAVVEPTLVVLPSSVWRAELEAELLRLGVPATKAASSAGRVLHRICGHAGWPRSSYLVHGEAGDEPAPGREPSGAAHGGRRVNSGPGALRPPAPPAAGGVA